MVGIPPRPSLLSWQTGPPGFVAELLVKWSFLATPRVDLWFVPLDEVRAGEGVRRYQQWLNSAERLRSDRFKFAWLRERFIITRGILRQLIGFYRDQPPDQVDFSYSDRGKPLVVPAVGQAPLHFNLSHAHHYALYGFSPCPLGIDLELTGKQRDGLGIAQRFFAPEEQAVLAQAPPSSQEITFLRHWVCKEAVLKATGEGLAGNLHNTAIRFSPQLHLTAPQSPDLILQEVTPSLKTIAAVALLLP
ncbi:MAG: 4'-phosphopantetheinyl transferase family protein [Prochlorotrichaceae cyanobacterium]